MTVELYNFFNKKLGKSRCHKQISLCTDNTPLLCKKASDLFGCWKQSASYRHLSEIDCSSAVDGRPAAGAESGGKLIHQTRMWRQKVLHSDCCGWRHNYYSQQRQAGWANEQSTFHRCLWCIIIITPKFLYTKLRRPSHGIFVRRIALKAESKTLTCLMFTFIICQNTHSTNPTCDLNSVTKL